jgi:hypothetical protein
MDMDIPNQIGRTFVDILRAFLTKFGIGMGAICTDQGGGLALPLFVI